MLDSSIVSSIGPCVAEVEEQLAKYASNKHCTLVVSGTAALHAALVALGVKANDEVITQSLTFLATCNAISYQQAHPIFMDVEEDSFGICPGQLERFLAQNTYLKDNICINRHSGRIIKACVAMHTLGHIGKINEIQAICKKYHISLIEDAAEAMGSMRDGMTFGKYSDVAITSFNGNKIITAGGGGAIFTNDDTLHNHVQHITKNAKQPHQYEYIHDQIGFNYRMPNLNAALLKAQLELIDQFLINKKELAQQYDNFFDHIPTIEYVKPPPSCDSNFWLNAIKFNSKEERSAFLQETNDAGMSTRPLWKPMHQLIMFKNCQKTKLNITEDLYQKIVTLPSSVTCLK